MLTRKGRVPVWVIINKNARLANCNSNGDDNDDDEMQGFSLIKSPGTDKSFLRVHSRILVIKRAPARLIVTDPDPNREFYQQDGVRRSDGALLNNI